MKLLLDTNIILDVMLDRKPFSADSAKIVAAAESGILEGSLCATTITTIHYLAAKALGAKAAAKEIGLLLQIFRVAPVNETVLKAALQRHGQDYEDLVLLEAARSFGAEGFVTRNPADFSKADLPIYVPADIVVMLKL
ncbi:MAG: PIN domain-containing protein [Terrimicrobiaceae bacterium]|nr:PIN domain-containing protein [Terrimicrobiaceae bacterium]